MRAEAEAVLAALVDREVISPEERLLIVGHALHGRELKDIAREQGMRYRAASKRYQRAVAKVRRALTGAEIFLENLVSPGTGSRPFLLRERGDGDGTRGRSGEQADGPGSG